MFDIQYMLFVMLPIMLFSGLASFLTKRTFKKYSQVMARSRMTGEQAAQTILRTAGIHDVEVEMVQGFLSDHYDPMNKKLRLSPAVYQNPSLSAIGVACHEAGHAIQHANSYAPLNMRSAIVPMTNISSKLAFPLLLGGMLMGGLVERGGSQFSQILIFIGLAAFAMTFIFALVTLPVEWDASARAKKLMVSAGIVSESEAHDAGNVLNAAFMTYLASAVGSLMTLLYYMWRMGLLGGRRN